MGENLWRNWVGNQACSPSAIAAPGGEDEIASLVVAAEGRGEGVRVAAAGHSVTPLVATDGLLLDLRNLRGVRSIDAARRRAVAGPATTVGDFGDPLWAERLALENQGDIDTQQIAGAVATATHGSGLALGSFSATVRRVRLVTGGGRVIEIGEAEPDLLHAAQVAVCMLGVITELELQVVPAHRLRERIEYWSFADAWERFDEMARAHRHFSFFWLPSEQSAALYDLRVPDAVTLADTCFVKIYDEADPEQPDAATPGARVDRSYRIYPTVFEPNFYELEYFVPYDRGREAIAAMRELMLAALPLSVFPLEVRTVARDEALLSHSHGRDSVVLSVSGMPGTAYDPYLRGVDRLLGEFDARVHWGKLHFLTREQLLARYPAAERFIEIRRELDPAGTFLNDHLRPLFQ
jgi:FAD/FMN-containing dehydrogenase